VQARRIRPDTGPIDRRRIAAAGLSAVLPGLGQAFNGRRRLALWFLIPSLILLGLGLIILRTQSTTRLVAWAVEPAILGTLLTLNLALLAWRLVASGQAFLDTRRAGPTGRIGAIGMLVVVLLVIAPHVFVWRYGTLAGDTFAKVFAGQVLSSTSDPRTENPQISLTDRVNVLLVGVDATKKRSEMLTDTMMVVSLDPVGHTVSMVSLPRDLVNVPLGAGGDVYGPKLNSLLSYADRNPDLFPKGGMRTLEGAVSALLGIPITYYARIDFSGFVDMVDAVGGVDIKVKKDLDDPTYDGYGLGHKGFSITKGPHHLTGAEALAYARIRKPLGESDFTRADRQQRILMALKDGATDGGGSLLWELPKLLDAVGKTIKTDLPPDRLPDLAAVMDEMSKAGVTRAVINHPLVDTKDTRYGSSLVPDLKAIRAMAARLFPAPGTAPVPWPTPKPTAVPDATEPASASPKP
jgi:polyisoprenyl-teichoic acid--peptidoglycan teichoic acid transferase